MNNRVDERPVKKWKVILSTLNIIKMANDKYRNGKSIYGNHIWARLAGSAEMQSQSMAIKYGLE